jgi:hypothetical protein
MLLLCCYFSLYHCIWLYENKDIYNTDVCLGRLIYIHKQKQNKTKIKIRKKQLEIDLKKININ